MGWVGKWVGGQGRVGKGETGVKVTNPPTHLTSLGIDRGNYSSRRGGGRNVYGAIENFNGHA